MESTVLYNSNQIFTAVPGNDGKIYWIGPGEYTEFPTTFNALPDGIWIKGQKGATGPYVPSVSHGPPHYIGATGVPGATGATGPAGIDGAFAALGATGASGPTGPAGSSGTPGSVGSPGSPGPSGLSGATGATGPPGIPGVSAAMGATGATGSKGATGSQGPAGVLGSQGSTGATGAGATGATGPPGAGASGSITPDTIRIDAYDKNAVAPYTGYAVVSAVNAHYQTLVTTPTFSDVLASIVDLRTNMGMNNYGTDAGGTVTTDKLTQIALAVESIGIGSGQHFAFTCDSQIYGMSDAFCFGFNCTYATGPIAGDEGQAWTAGNYCQQQNFLARGDITSVKRTTYSTTATAPITASKDPQVIPVASTTGANVGDWIVFNQAPPTGYNLICAGKIEAIDTVNHTITCICIINISGPPHAATITPAMVLGIPIYLFGQDRVLVNLDGASYSTGLANQNGTGALGGSGTSWSANMVGGDANNIGAISFDDDTYNNFPFNSISNYNGTLTTSSTSTTIGTGSKTFTVGSSGLFFLATHSVLIARTSDQHNSYMKGTVTSYSGTTLVVNVTSAVGSGAFTDWTISNLSTDESKHPLRSWYQITSVASPTSLGILSNSCAGAASYNGRAPWSPSFTSHPQYGPRLGTYLIKPAARILLLPNEGDGVGGSLAICETTNSVWNVGDKVECVICPYPDAHGFDYRIAQWNPGGVRRQFLSLTNFGAREFAGCIGIGQTPGGTTGQPGSDDVSFDIGIAMDGCRTPISITVDPAGTQAMYIGAYNTNKMGTRINWYSGCIGNNYVNSGLDIGLCVRGNDGNNGMLRGTAPSYGNNPDTIIPMMEWGGWLRLSGLGNSRDSLIEFGNQGDYTSPNYQIYAHTSWASPRSRLGNFGIDFNQIAGSGPNSGVTTTIFTMGDHCPLSDNPFVGLCPYGPPTTSNTTNQRSAELHLVTTVWDGTAAKFQSAALVAVPESGVDKAKVSLRTRFLDPVNDYYYAYYKYAFEVFEDGKFFFGQIDNYGQTTGIINDPSNITPLSTRTVTWPDISGGNVVVGSTAMPTSSNAPGTPGEVRRSSTEMALCYATNSWAKWSISTLFPTPTAPAGQALIFVNGDSIGAGYGNSGTLVSEGGATTNTSINAFPNIVHLNFPGRLSYFSNNSLSGVDVNWATNSTTVTRMADTLSAKAARNGAATPIAVIQLGHNGPVGGVGYGASATLTALFSAADSYRSLGWKVVMCTLTPDGVTAGFEAFRTTVNTGIRGAVGTHIDAVCDFDTDPIMGNIASTSNPTYFQADQVHPADAGQALLATVFQHAISSIIPPSVAPTAFPQWDATYKHSAVTIGGGGYTATGGASFQGTRSTTWRDSGKWYTELKGTVSLDQMIGLVDAGTNNTDYLGQYPRGLGAWLTNATPFNLGFTAVNAPTVNGGSTAGTVIRIAIDIDAGKLWMTRDGNAFPGSGDPTTGASPSYTFDPNTRIHLAYSGNVAGAVAALPANAGSFVYSIPTGYSPF